MGRRFIKELKVGETVDEVFLLQEMEVKPYGSKIRIKARLADRSGAIDAIMWDVNASTIESFGKEGFLRIQGVVGEYNNSRQLEIKRFYREETNLKLEEIFPWTEKDVSKLKEELEGMVAAVEHPYLSLLLKEFLKDEDLYRRLSLSPASVSYHHAYLGGLLEHTLSIARLALEVSRHYPILNKDLLLTGAILHDIGKLRELSYRGGFQYTDQGRLVGHIVTGVLMVEEKASGIKDFPSELLDLVRHIILSHHGDADTTSPRTPLTAEALAVHYLDNLDAKLQAFYKAVSEDKNPQSNWTEYQKIFGSSLYKGTERRPSSE